MNSQMYVIIIIERQQTLIIIFQKYMETQHQIMFYTTAEAMLNAEVNTIVAGIGGGRPFLVGARHSLIS